MMSKQVSNIQELAEAVHQKRCDGLQSFPAAYVPRPKFTDKSANGLTNCILQYCKLTGIFCEQINTTGRTIRKRGKTIYIPTAGRRGSADLHLLIHGKAVMCEIKTGHDRQSDAQKEYERQVTGSGAVYMIVHSFDEFITQIKSLS